jgi:hypothetical protein
MEKANNRVERRREPMKYMLIEKVAPESEAITLANVKVVSLGVFESKKELTQQLALMKKLVASGKLAKDMALQVVEIDG